MVTAGCPRGQLPQEGARRAACLPKDAASCAADRSAPQQTQAPACLTTPPGATCSSRHSARSVFWCSLARGTCPVTSDSDTPGRVAQYHGYTGLVTSVYIIILCLMHLGRHIMSWLSLAYTEYVLLKLASVNFSREISYHLAGFFFFPT